jgi:hypothetical protein
MNSALLTYLIHEQDAYKGLYRLVYLHIYLHVDLMAIQECLAEVYKSDVQG